MRFLSNYFYDDLDQRKDLEQEAYVVLDLNLRYEWKNMTLKLYTQNTTNSRYAFYARNMGIGETYYIPANPFNVGGQISYRY